MRGFSSCTHVCSAAISLFRGGCFFRDVYDKENLLIFLIVAVLIIFVIKKRFFFVIKNVTVLLLKAHSSPGMAAVAATSRDGQPLEGGKDDAAVLERS